MARAGIGSLGLSGVADVDDVDEDTGTGKGKRKGKGKGKGRGERRKLSVEEVADELFRGADEGEGGNGDGQLQLSEFAALMAEVKEAETEGGNSDRKHDEL